MTQLLVAGSYNATLTVVAPTLPKPGETVKGDSFHTGPGGKGANQAIGARRLGASVAFVTMLGTDDFGDEARELLEREGLPADAIQQTTAAPTGVALIAVDAAGANQISVAPGANALLRARHAEPGLVAAAGLLLAQLECDRELFDDLADAVHARGGRVILNPAPAEELPPGTLNRCDFLIPNETELASLTGMPTGDDAEVLRAALRLTGLGVGVVVATLGERGALWTDGHAARRYPAPRVRAVDTTGAGDAFCAGFAAALCAGRSVDAAIAAGSVSGAFCVTRAGVLDGLARPAELAPLPAAAPSWPVELPVSLR